MLGRGGRGQSPDSSGAATDTEPIGALRERLDQDERVCHRLEGSAPLVHERDGDGGPLPDTSARGALAVLTDRRLYFVLLCESGTEVVEVPYRDVRSVDGSGGLLGSRLEVRVWNRGTYRLSAGRGAEVPATADFLDVTSQTYQRVLAALEEAREHVTALGKRIEDGDADGIAAANEAVREQLSLARTRIDTGPAEVRDALKARVTEVATELQRTRMRAHLARASALVERGDGLTDRDVWDDAVAAYTRAADHLETAHDVSTARDFGLAESIEREGERLQRRVETLEALPLQLAEDARAAARGADDLEGAVPAWAAALEHYRAAVTAGWGTPVDFAGDRETLRTRVEWTARNLIVARCELARRLRDEGDDRRMSGADAAAADRYEAALSQVEAARSVARELRAGDLEAIDDRRAVLLDRLRAARGDGPAEPTAADPAAEDLLDDAGPRVGDPFEDGGTDAGSGTPDPRRDG